MDIDTSGHFGDMLKERNLQEEWVMLALDKPDFIEKHDDGTTHYIRQVQEFGNRWLRVVINESFDPAKGVTAIF